MRDLGFDDRNVSIISFVNIAQPWLRDLAKRWARWRLSSGLMPVTAVLGVRAVTRFGRFLAMSTPPVERLDQVDRTLLERYLAFLHSELGHTKTIRNHMIGQLNLFFIAVRQHRWHDGLPATAMFFPEDLPARSRAAPKALSEHVMAQLEHPDSLGKMKNPAYRLLTMVLMRCGLRVDDGLHLRRNCIVRDADSAPYLRYYNRKLKREALVPIDEELERRLVEHRAWIRKRVPGDLMFPRVTNNPDGRYPTGSDVYRSALKTWLKHCDVRDEYGDQVHLTPHQWRHTLGTRLINRDVPQEVVRRILDHDSPQMTAHYAQLNDHTVRRHWEAARKVNVDGETVTLDPAGPLAEAAWAKQRVGRATQALPNGYCGLPVVKTCPHANACLTCPMFITTPEFLPEHHQHRSQVLQIISAAEARGQQRLAEMNQQVLTNLEKIITALESDRDTGTSEDAGAR